MRDGVRRITQITEIIGMEGEVVTTQDLFTYDSRARPPTASSPAPSSARSLRPHFLPRADYFGLDKVLMEAMG